MTVRRNPTTARVAAGLITGCAALLAAGCAGATTSAPGQAGPAAIPAHTATTASLATGVLATGPARQRLAASYLAVARPANRQLDRDFDGLEDDDANLAAAAADLRAAAATERRFDRLLLRITFPAGTEPFVAILYTVNQHRAQLTITAAGSTSLSELHAYERRLTAANEPVEQAVQVIRDQLGLPPADTD